MFSLECIRHVLSANLVHFMPAKKGHIFKLLNYIATFTINSRHATSIVERMLREINFPQGDVWNYDPKGFLTSRKNKIKSTTYMHEPRPLIEWKANLDTWPLDTHMEAESSTAEGKGDNFLIEVEEE